MYMRSSGTLMLTRMITGSNQPLPCTALPLSKSIKAKRALDLLWYHTGQPFRGAARRVQWARDPYPYDYGVAPAIAMYGSTIVEVHQGQEGFGPLWYHTGWVQPDGTVRWARDPYPYDYGVKPAIVMYDTDIVEVHQGQEGIGPLWYHTGQMRPFGNVWWDLDAYPYDYGVNPSLSRQGTYLVEVHQAAEGVGPLWYHRGQFGQGIVYWDPNAFPYDNGTNPAVAGTAEVSVNYVVIEVHQGQVGFGALWHHNGEFIIP